MKLAKIFSTIALFCAFLLFTHGKIHATTHTISFGGTSFSPNTLSVTTGDTVTWTGAFGFHQIQSTSVPATAATFGPTSNTATSFSYVVTVAGTYNYQCNIHFSMGMTGTFTATAAAASTKAITLSATSVDFGSLRVSTSKNKTFTVNSTGPDAALTISSSPLSVGTNFSNSPTSANRSISVGSSETETITFSPASRGAFSDILTINSDATTTADQVKKVTISGTGINGVYSGLTTVSFDKVRVGNTKQLTYTITNTGDDTLFLATPTVSGTGYSIVTGLASQSIAPNGTGSIVLKFSPTAKQNYLGSLTITAQNNVTVPAISLTGTGTAPVIGVASLYDMGLTLVGGMLSGNLQINNTGDDTLHITGVSILNTLQGPKFTLNSGSGFTILPGANSFVGFTYTSSTESFDAATLVINSDDQAASTKQVSIIAKSGLPKLSVNTKDTIDFGNVRIGGIGNALLTITNLGTYDLTLQISQFSPSQFALAGSVTSIPPQGNTQAGFAFTPTNEGVVTGMAVILTNDQKNPQDTIYFKGVGIKSSLDFPTVVDFHQLNINKTKDTVLTFKNFGSASAKIFSYKLSVPNSGFILLDTLAHTIGAKDSTNTTIKIRFAPTIEQPYNATLSIRTDDGTAPIRIINLSGVGINSKLSTDQTSIDFGVLDSGVSLTKTFTITNNGTAPTTITALTPTGDASFAITPVTLPLQIGPGSKVDVSVTFAPKAAGTFDGVLTITASEGSPISIGLHGKGKVEVVLGSVRSGAEATGMTMTLLPNPNNGSATIKFVLQKPLEIKLELFDATGKLVHSYNRLSINTGEYSLPLASEKFPSGEYYLRAIIGGRVASELKVMIVH